MVIMTYGDDVWRAVAELSGLLLSEENEETTLRRVAELAVRSIHGCDAVGVTIFRDGEPVTNAATGGQVYEVDNYQYVIGSGPCLQTITDHEVIEIQDMREDNRFGQFAEHAVARGILASLSFPLLVRGEALGALNLYATTADAFGPDDRQTGQMFAAQAGVVLANSQTYAASVELAEHLRTALDSRAIIDQAMGILIGENGYDQDAAFTDLREASQLANVKLKHVAKEIVQRAIQRSTE